MWLYVPALSPACPSALEQGASNSGCISSCPSTAVWVTSNGKPVQRPLSWPGWKHRSWLRLLSGTISRPSTADRGAEQWISSLQATRANHSAPLESALERLTRAISGPMCTGLLRRYAQQASSSKTSQLTLLAALTPCGETSSELVTRLRREYSARQKWARPTSELASSSWPTPLAQDCEMAGAASRGTAYLTNAARHWPTPAARDYRTPNLRTFETRGGGKNGEQLPNFVAHRWPTPTGNDALSDTRANRTPSPGGAVRPILSAAARLWPTPTEGDADGAGSRNQPGSNARPGLSLTDAVQTGSSGASRSSLPDPETTTAQPGHACSPKCRRLNPPFVEWLMGWPVGWTDCGSPATGLSLWLQRWRSYLFGSSSGGGNE
jgi:hypothetical protein